MLPNAFRPTTRAVGTADRSARFGEIMSRHFLIRRALTTLLSLTALPLLHCGSDGKSTGESVDDIITRNTSDGVIIYAENDGQVTR